MLLGSCTTGASCCSSATGLVALDGGRGGTSPLEADVAPDVARACASTAAASAPDSLLSEAGLLVFRQRVYKLSSHTYIYSYVGCDIR
jgi:hypothetical protein